MTRKIKRNILIGIIIALVLFYVIAFIITHILMKQNFGRGSYSEYSLGCRYAFYENDYPRRAVNFVSGENTLYGYVYGEGNDKGLVVVSHGIGGGHENYIKEIIWFVNQGYCVFAFDNTGSCESDGKGTMGLSQSALDLDAALTYIENDSSLSGMKKLLFGHSWGGFAVTAVLNFDHDIAASVSVSGYAYPIEMITEFADRMMGGFTKVVYPLICFDNWLTFGKYADLSAVDGINSVDTPVLVIHGTADETISYEHSSIISKKDKITNPNVEYLTFSENGINGHNTIFYSKEASLYRTEMNEEYARLKEKYPDGVPDDVNKDFFDGIDKVKANEINYEMMEKINIFYEKALTD